jgi:hypothetical protein
MYRSTRRALLVLSLIVLLPACTASVGEPSGIGTEPVTTPEPPPPSAPDVEVVPPVCTEPTVSTPRGRTVDVTAGLGPGPVGLAAAATGPVEVLELGAPDGADLVTVLADAFEPCPDVSAVMVTGHIGELVVAAMQAAAERRPFAPTLIAAGADEGGAADERSAAAATASVELLSLWEADELIIVDERDVAAWATLVADATSDSAPSARAVPLLVPLRSEAAGEAHDDVAGTGPSADTDPLDATDPIVAALALVPSGVTVTAVASDIDRARELGERLLAAGIEGVDLRILSLGSSASDISVAGHTLWLVAPTDPLRAVVVAAAAGARGEALLAVDPRDAQSVLSRVDSIRRVAPQRLLLVADGDLEDADVAWQLDAALHTPLLPWGGLLPLEGTRIVALYGTPDVAALGALGQQDLDATIVRARDQAVAYEDGDRTVVPGFDVIATVASASAGPLGDYSQRIPVERLRPLVDRARDEGMVVFIDLQPGRTDFLTQAQEYEELLLEPHVFLALDPEWRLGPNEVHLRRIGSVSAAEVQTVADWLAELVRRERLPQKVLMLHQFTMSMLQDRDTIVIPPELIGVLHVDGQGELRKKEGTYRLLTQTRAEHWQWGWKQFLRIDTPSVMEPGRVIDRDPSPVVVTYQ